MCYQCPFAVLPVVVPAPRVSPQRFDSPWHTRLFVGESWHTSPGDHIPAGRLFNCQGASPLACLDWEGCFGGVQKSIFPLTCSHWETCFGRVFCEIIYPSTCSDWETCFFRVFYEKALPLLVPTGSPLLLGCFSKISA